MRCIGGYSVWGEVPRGHHSGDPSVAVTATSGGISDRPVYGGGTTYEGGV